MLSFFFFILLSLPRTLAYFSPIRSQTRSVMWQELPICTQPGISLTPQQGAQLSGHFDTTLFRIPLLTFTSRMWLPNQKCTFMELKTLKPEWKQLDASSFIRLLGNAALISSHIGQIRKVKMVSYCVLDLSFSFFLFKLLTFYSFLLWSLTSIVLQLWLLKISLPWSLNFWSLENTTLVLFQHIYWYTFEL